MRRVAAQKYHNRHVMQDGHLFQSAKEAARYSELKLLLQAGKIADLILQPCYPLRVNGVLVARYYADFQYMDTETGKMVLEDVKGVRTQVYLLKRKLVKALYAIDIQEM